jgi:hypothetical protein
LAAFALLCPRAAFAQYELAGSLTSTTCNDTGGGAVAQETGCLVMNLAPAIGSVSVQVTANADTLQFEVTDSSTWVSANAYPLPSGSGGHKHDRERDLAGGHRRREAFPRAGERGRGRDRRDDGLPRLGARRPAVRNR